MDEEEVAEVSEEPREMTGDNQRVVIIGAWLARFDDLFSTHGVRLADRPNIFDDFAAALSDISPADLEFAFEQWRKNGKKFPSPADLREQLKKREESFDQYESEKAWDHVRYVIGMFWRGDMGMLPYYADPEVRLSDRIREACEITMERGCMKLTPKPFDKRTEYAIQNVGGISRIYGLPAGSEFDFVRRDFCKHYRYAIETNVLLAPSKEEAKQILNGLQKQIGDKK